MNFRYGRGANLGGGRSGVPKGCGTLLAIIGLIFISPVGVWLVRAVGYMALFVGLVIIAIGIYYWLTKSRRNHY